MTGWRIGWLVLPEDLVRPVECLAQNLFICAPHVAQVAAEAAFDCQRRAGGQYRRATAGPATTLLQALPEAGFDRLSPADGAFYLWADVGHLTNDSSPSASACWRRRGSPRRRAWISTARGAAASCASAIAGRKPTWPRRRRGWRPGWERGVRRAQYLVLGRKALPHRLRDRYVGTINSG